MPSRFAIATLPLVLSALVACGGGGDTADGSTASCSDPVVPFAKSDAGKVLHFDLTAGCVAITFDPSLPALDRGTINGALGAWASIPGSKLCFAAATESSTEPDDPADRRIHFKAVDMSAPDANVSSVAYVNTTGVLVFSLVSYSSNQGGNTALLSSLIGSAIGLGYADPGTDSVMAQPAKLSAPTAHDRVAVAALYGGTCAL